MISRLPVMPAANEKVPKSAIDETVAPLDSIKETKRDLLQFLHRETTPAPQRRARIRFKGYAKKSADISISSMSTNLHKIFRIQKPPE